MGSPRTLKRRKQRQRAREEAKNTGPRRGGMRLDVMNQMIRELYLPKILESLNRQSIFYERLSKMK